MLMKTKLHKHLILALGILILGNTGAQSESGGDPTHLSPALQEALSSIQQVEPERASRRTPDTEAPVRLRGRLIQGERKAVILNIGEDFFILREGDRVSHLGRNFLLEEITPDSITLSGPAANQQLILR